jgi:hypothetical protein
MNLDADLASLLVVMFYSTAFSKINGGSVALLAVMLEAVFNWLT